MPVMMRRAKSRRDAGYVQSGTPRVVPRQWSLRGMNGRITFSKETRLVRHERFSRKSIFGIKGKKYFYT